MNKFIERDGISFYLAGAVSKSTETFGAVGDEGICYYIPIDLVDTCLPEATLGELKLLHIVYAAYCTTLKPAISRQRSRQFQTYRSLRKLGDDDELEFLKKTRANTAGLGVRFNMAVLKKLLKCEANRVVGYANSLSKRELETRVTGLKKGSRPLRRSLMRPLVQFPDGTLGFSLNPEIGNMLVGKLYGQYASLNLAGLLECKRVSTVSLVPYFSFSVSRVGETLPLDRMMVLSNTLYPEQVYEDYDAPSREPKRNDRSTFTSKTLKSVLSDIEGINLLNLMVATEGKVTVTSRVSNLAFQRILTKRVLKFNPTYCSMRRVPREFIVKPREIVEFLVETFEDSVNLVDNKPAVTRFIENGVYKYTVNQMMVWQFIHHYEELAKDVIDTNGRVEGYNGTLVSIMKMAAERLPNCTTEARDLELEMREAEIEELAGELEEKAAEIERLKIEIADMEWSLASKQEVASDHIPAHIPDYFDAEVIRAFRAYEEYNNSEMQEHDYEEIPF